MPSVCRFELNKPNASYFSGETISGTIILNTTNSKHVRDVTIIFLGEGKVNWEENDSRSNSDGSSTTHTTNYTSNELYVNNTTLVMGEGVLPAGTHTYAFNIYLPWECPTSCEGEYGHVRYEISLKLNRYYRFDNVYKKPVTIIKTIDLNMDPGYKIPIEAEAIKNLCCWPCSRGKIYCRLTVPFGAYAPGQMVRYALHINNQSSTDVQGYRIEFTKKMIFTAKSPNRKERRTKCVIVKTTFSDPKCLRLSNRLIENHFRLPSTPPTAPRSSIICVEYNLKVTLELSSCSRNPQVEVPIIIGTIPIRESLPSEPCLVDISPQPVNPSAPEMRDELGRPHQGDFPPNYNDINVSIEFSGEGKVKWSESERHRRSDGTDSTHSVDYTSNETYISNTTHVSGEGTLPPGTYQYNFQILLPLHCPTSCEGRYGHVRYVVRLILNRPYRFDNEYSKVFTVIKTRDLNLDPSLRVPVASEETFSGCCWSCSGGTINATLSLPLAGFTVGQTLKYALYIQNQSMDDITGYTVKFKRRMTFVARRPNYRIRYDKDVLYKNSYDTECLRLSTRLFENEFVVPSTAPTTEGNQIISTEYYIKVEMHMSGCTSDNDMEIPIIIGTIPISESFMPQLPAVSAETDNFMGATAPDLTSNDEGSSDKPPAYQQLGPPSFEEAIRCSTPFEDTDKNEHHRHIGFRPLYPSYSKSYE